MRVKGPGHSPAPRISEEGEVPDATSARSAQKADGFETARKPAKVPVKAPTKSVATEPSVPKVNGQLPTYQAEPGSLIQDGVAPEDVVQGNLGDCYFLSSVASLAQRDPSAIEKAIRANGDGTYTVQLYAPQANGSLKPTQVTVDALIPQNAKGAVFASSPNPKELWVQIMEKAFAKLQHGYTVIDQGGAETDAMAALTGKPSSSTDVKPQNAEALYAQLGAASRAGKLTTAGTYSNRELTAALGAYHKAGLTSLDPKTTYAKQGLLDDHAYTVLGVSEENGQKFVELRNPWGDTEPAGNGPNDGEFKLPLKDFAALFQEVSVGG